MAFQSTSNQINQASEFRSLTWPKLTFPRRPMVSSVGKHISKFNEAEKKNEKELRTNPFSKTYEIPKFDKNAADYARPSPGSKTEARAKKAGVYMTREIVFLCDLISQSADGEPPNQTIKFGPLFYSYSLYSSQLVGMLVRARKYGLVDFEGEMLYQGQDDDKIIRLLKPIEEIRRIVRFSGDPVHCVAIAD
uniref:Costars domain-containing protein n=1 Tax=Panagrolaimus superbus TaxID=310955 RepID=A0A914Z891_9BILA